MNSSHLGQLIALTLFTTLAAPCWLAAQEILKRETKQAHHKLMELVMLDGPYTYSSLDGGGFRILNNARAVPTSVATALHMIGFGFSFRMSMQG